MNARYSTNTSKNTTFAMILHISADISKIVVKTQLAMHSKANYSMDIHFTMFCMQYVGAAVYLAMLGAVGAAC